MDIYTTITLNNGIKIPIFGLGTYKANPGSDAYNAVLYALEFGYRHIDTAALYENEEDVANAVRDSGIPRKDIFIVTKLYNTDQGYDKAMKAFDKSLKKLKCDYVDLYLIHWPVRELRSDSWRALEKLYALGLCRSIGISNYTIRHIDEMLGKFDVVPAVNQVEFSPFLYQKDLLDYCNKIGIVLEAYTPLVRGRMSNNPVLQKIAGKYGKTWAQILIRWGLQHNVIEIPKSSHKDRILENSQVFDFEISDEDMTALNNLDQNFRIAWDPSNVA